MNNALKNFYESLDSSCMYRVDAKNYSHCRPTDMTEADITSLYEKSVKMGINSINEDVIVYNSMLLD